jgi:hypothetical protein
MSKVECENIEWTCARCEWDKGLLNWITEIYVCILFWSNFLGLKVFLWSYVHDFGDDL